VAGKGSEQGSVSSRVKLQRHNSATSRLLGSELSAHCQAGGICCAAGGRATVVIPLSTWGDWTQTRELDRLTETASRRVNALHRKWGWVVGLFTGKKGV
jgi:hypothetical protein